MNTQQENYTDRNRRGNIDFAAKKARQAGRPVSAAVVNNFIKSIPAGRFLSINGYKNLKGETANYVVQSGVSYSNILERDCENLHMLQRLSIRFNVSHNVYIDKNDLHHLFYSGYAKRFKRDSDLFIHLSRPVDHQFQEQALANSDYYGDFDLSSDIFSNRKSSDKMLFTMSFSILSSHPLCSRVIHDMIYSRADSLSSKPADKKWIENDLNNSLSLRNTLLISKKIVKESDKTNLSVMPVSLPSSALKEAITNEMLMSSRLRSFNLNQNSFESLVVNKTEITASKKGFLMIDKLV